MRMLLPERLARRQPLRNPVRPRTDARVPVRSRFDCVVRVLLRRRPFLESIGRGQDVGALVGELVFKVLGAEDRDLGEDELALDRLGARVVEDGPDGDLCEDRQLPPFRFDDGEYERTRSSS